MLSPKLAVCRSNILVLHLFSLFALILLATGEITNISYPQFSANDSTLKAYGDIEFNADNQSWIMNAKAAANRTPTCAVLMYSKTNVRIQDSVLGKFASFSTSFTFKYTTPPNQPVWDVNTTDDASPVETALALWVSKSTIKETSTQNFDTWASSQPDGCLPLGSQGNVSFTVIFRTVYNYKRNEPSNNFIGVNDRWSHRVFHQGSTHNLCGGNQTHCSYLSNGGSFTAWIDFTPQRTLQVRLMNGSHPHSDKPLDPLLDYLDFIMPTAVGDYISLNFLGSSTEAHIESHELSSWSFYSNGIQETIPPSKKAWIGPLFGGIGTLATLSIVGCLSLWFAKRRRLVAFNYTLGPRAFSYKELCIATQNFSQSEKLGSGGFGTVYRGSFQSETNNVTLLAVKRINFESKHAESTFLAEISSLNQIRHVNVVQLQGWCHEKGRMLLVYDYMSNGGLNEWLHDSSGGNGGRRGVLSLRVRHQILMGVAAALEYLHKDCPQCVLHRDIKSSNVMLDADMKAHLGDFGLARLMDHEKLDRTTMAGGTLGYMAPEMPYTGKATKESDIYSFGILILEVLCGRRPLEWRALEPEDMSLLQSVWRAHERSRITTCADPRLLQTHQHSTSAVSPCDDELTDPEMHVQPRLSNSQSRTVAKNSSNSVTVEVNVSEAEKTMVKNLLHLGLLCCLPNPKARQSIDDVIRILQEIGDIDNGDGITTTVIMPRVPDTKPLGLYHSMEFSQIADPIEKCKSLPIEVL